MNTLLGNYLAKKEAEIVYEAIENRNKILIQEGLFEKEYSDTYSAEYCFEENGKYYKKTPIVVSDEEFQEIMKYVKIEEKEHNHNGYGVAMKVVAILIFISGLILGIILGTQEVGVYYTEFSFGVAAIYWGASFISGMFFFGLSEIIELLNDIKQNI